MIALSLTYLIGWVWPQPQGKPRPPTRPLHGLHGGAWTGYLKEISQILSAELFYF